MLSWKLHATQLTFNFIYYDDKFIISARKVI